MPTTSVFISYAREDSELVARLRRGLEARGIAALGDWSLTAGDSYEQRLRAFILTAEAFLFIISPESIASDPCQAELTTAVEQRKSILPISHRPHGDDTRLDSALRVPQWTFMREQDDFEARLAELVAAIHTDFDLMEIHSRLLLGADGWHNSGYKSALLLRGEALAEAETWLSRTSAHPEKLPQPTAGELAYIDASRRGRARRMRVGGTIATVVIVVLALLAVVAWIQRNNALQNAEEARQQELAARANAARAIDVGKRRLVIGTLLLNPEGNTFDTATDLTGDFTFGLGGWAQRTGGLHDILAAFQKSDPALFARTFAGGDASVAADLLEYTGQQGGGTETGGAPDPRFTFGAEPWVSRFKQAGGIPAFQSVQLEVFTNEYLQFMEQLRQLAPEVQSERGVAFLLDLVRQFGVGSAKQLIPRARRPGTTESQMLRELSRLSVARVQATFPRFARGVERRREKFLTTPYLSDAAVGF